MTMKQNEMLNKWCYSHDLTYFIDSEKKHCLCNADWIIRFNTEKELIKYIEEH